VVYLREASALSGVPQGDYRSNGYNREATALMEYNREASALRSVSQGDIRP